jgi:purine-binding chemotaxis protein CheW
MTLDLSNRSDSFDSANSQSEQQTLISNGALKTELEVENYKFFSFFIHDTEYLLPIANVEEVTNLPSISFLPNANRFLDGAFHLRGSILPAINMRKISGSPRGEPSPESRLIVVREAGLDFGLIVDRINHVVTLSADHIERQTQSSYPNSENFCSQKLKNGNRFTGIIDLSKLLTLITGETNLDLS